MVKGVAKKLRYVTAGYCSALVIIAGTDEGGGWGG